MYVKRFLSLPKINLKKSANVRFDGWKLLTDIYSMYSLHPKYRKLADFFSAIDQAILRRAAT